MPIGEICVREVVICNRATTVLEAAQLMRRFHEESGGERIPVGLITDRDIVIGVTALQLDPTTITCRE